MTTDRATASLATARTPGAIAIIHLRGHIDATLERLGVKPVAPGSVARRLIPGIDDAVVARPGADHAVVTPHGGPAIVAAVLERLAESGVAIDQDCPATLFPEARSAHEARALLALARAASPLAAPLLLEQHDRWAAWSSEPGSGPWGEMERVSAVLDRLIDPPLVVAAGPPNIGKSTLVNALAGRSVSVVADEPGVTRDHVGVVLELDGLAVRWVDAPGLREPQGAAEAAAIGLARPVIADADLVLLCGDAVSPPPLPGEIGVEAERAMTAGLRSDLGPTPGAEIEVAATERRGLGELAEAVRGRLVPDGALAWQGPWLLGPGPGAPGRD